MKKFIICFAAVFFTLFIIKSINPAENASTSDRLSEKILRLHVIANSDSEEDQSLKLIVKDSIVDFLEENTCSLNSKSDYIAYINSHSEEIKALAVNVIENAGYDYEVSLSVENTYFPVKSYGDLTFPNGNYDALCIRIGNAGGKNWWCVLYPPLCFVDLTYGIVPDDSKSDLHHVLGDNDYYALLSGQEDIEIEPRSLIADTIMDFFN